MVVTELLSGNAAKYAAEVALVEVNPAMSGTRRLTWKEFGLIESGRFEPYRKEITWGVFEEKANRCANFLIEMGVQRGEKVALIMYNCVDWLPLYFGILKAGAVAVPFNFRYSAEEILYCVELAEVRVVIFGAEFIGRIEAQAERLAKGRLLVYVGDGCPGFAEPYYIQTANCSGQAPNVQLSADDHAAIYFSSGTTGFPKAILHKHAALTQAAFMEQVHHLTNKNDCFLCIPPLYHTGAKFHWMGSLVAASRAVLLKGTNPKTILQTVSEEHCSIVWLLVPWAQDILDELDRGSINLNDYDLSNWRLMHIGAQPVPPSLIKRWLHYFPNHQYDTNYGLSESTGPGCVHLGLDNIHKLGAIGIPGFNWQAKIVDDNFNEVKTGEVGELAVSGPGVMVEYFNDPKATAEVLKNGWLLTGDIAFKDADGFIFLVDRKKDVIVSGGENIYPVQIEDFLRSCIHVKDAAVIGVADKRLGEIAVAVIELKPNSTCSAADILNFCNALPRYKRPKQVYFQTVPRNSTGKIDKPALRKAFNAVRLVAQESNS